MGCFGKKKKNEYKLSKSKKQKRDESLKLECTYKIQEKNGTKQEKNFTNISENKAEDDEQEIELNYGLDESEEANRQNSVETGVMPLNN